MPLFSVKYMGFVVAIFLTYFFHASDVLHGQICQKLGLVRYTVLYKTQSLKFLGFF